MQVLGRVKSVWSVVVAVAVMIGVTGCAARMEEVYEDMGYRPGVDYKSLAEGRLPKVIMGKHNRTSFEEVGYVEIGSLDARVCTPELDELLAFAVVKGASLVLYDAFNSKYVFMALRHDSDTFRLPFEPTCRGRSAG